MIQGCTNQRGKMLHFQAPFRDSDQAPENHFSIINDEDQVKITK